MIYIRRHIKYRWPYLSTGSPKKHENWKTTQRLVKLVTNMSEEIKGPSVNTNMRKISGVLIEFY